MAIIIIEEAPLSKFLFSDTRAAWLWLVIRVYLGVEWIIAGWEKVVSSSWVGPHAGAAIQGFVKGALIKTTGAHPDVSFWYAWFLSTFVVPHPQVWSSVVAYGELLVGLGLVLGALTGVAAFFGLFMNLNYLLAGTVSINPILFTLSIAVMLAWKVSGWIGLDRFLLPVFGTPWKANQRIQN